MRSAFIIHRSYSNPDDDWYPWLTQELEKMGYTVFRPKFPTPEHQSLQTWLEVFQPYAQHINSESIFIGHGIGCAFILHILEQDIPKTRALFLVAPFVEPLPHQALRMLEATFTTSPFAWKHIHEQYADSAVIYATDDPYVSSELGQQVADLLSSTVYTLPTGGHFAGMETFPYLLNCISETLNKEVVSPEVVAQENLENELTAIGIDLPKKTQEDEHEEQEEHTIEEEKKDTTLPEINTYYNDIMTTLTTSDTKTMAEVLRAERIRLKEERAHKRMFIIHVIYIVLAVIAIGVGVYFLNRASSPEFIPDTASQTQMFPSEIPADTQFVWNISNASLFDLRTTLDEWKAQPREVPDTIHHVLFTLGTEYIKSRVLSLDQVFLAFERSLPSELNESVISYMYGWYTRDARYPFMIMNINSFDRAFSGMALWEGSLVRDVSDIFFIDRTEWFEDIETVPFEEVLENNYTLHALYAHTVNEIRTTRTIDTVVTSVPKRHILTSDIIEAIETVTSDEIVFFKAHDAVRAFNVGDIIIGQPSVASTGFVRKITSFTLDETGMLHVATAQALGTDILPDTGEGEIKQRLNSSGTTEYYTSREEEEITRTEGERRLVLFYTFINDTQLLIATDPQIINVVLERTAKKIRMNTELPE